MEAASRGQRSAPPASSVTGERECGTFLGGRDLSINGYRLSMKVNEMSRRTAERPSGRSVSRQKAIEGCFEAYSIDWLREMIIHACRFAYVIGSVHRMSRQRDDRDVIRAVLTAPDFRRRLIAVQLGHLTIHENQIEPL